MTDNAQKAQRWQHGLAIYCIVLFLISMGLFWGEYYGAGDSAIALSEYEQPMSTAGVYLVGINTATEEQLESLPNVGPVLAQTIISYRAEHGPFSSFEALLEVRGIGEKTLEALLPLISLD